MITVAVLDFVYAALLVVAGLMMFMTVGMIGGGQVGGMVAAFGILFLLFGAGYLIVGIFLLKGAGGARVAQFILSGLAILGGVISIAQSGGQANLQGLVGLAIAILTIVLLLTRSASEYFRGGGGGGPRGGRRRR